MSQFFIPISLASRCVQIFPSIIQLTILVHVLDKHNNYDTYFNFVLSVQLWLRKIIRKKEEIRFFLNHLRAAYIYINEIHHVPFNKEIILQVCQKNAGVR